jgi:hypothetical protein
MPLTCNIDARGKRTRLITAIVLLLLATAIGLCAWKTQSRSLAVIAAVVAASGGFTLFEARAGWCALRAMGIKTRL